MDGFVRTCSFPDDQGLYPYLAALDSQANPYSCSNLGDRTDHMRARWYEFMEEAKQDRRVVFCYFRGSGYNGPQLSGPRLSGIISLVKESPNGDSVRANVHKPCVTPLAKGAEAERIATLLMEALEQSARAAGITILIADAETGTPGDNAFRECGFQKIGDVPSYYLAWQGERREATLFYKNLPPVEKNLGA